GARGGVRPTGVGSAPTGLRRASSSPVFDIAARAEVAVIAPRRPSGPGAIDGSRRAKPPPSRAAPTTNPARRWRLRRRLTPRSPPVSSPRYAALRGEWPCGGNRVNPRRLAASRRGQIALKEADGPSLDQHPS